MNVEDQDLVIVRGIKSDWFVNNFIDMEIYFGGNNKAVPAKDAYFIGFYLEKPTSAITHIGIVKDIIRTTDNGNNSATAYLSAVIKLPKSVETTDTHAIRKHEYWTLTKLNLPTNTLIFIRNNILTL